MKQQYVALIIAIALSYAIYNRNQLLESIKMDMPEKVPKKNVSVLTMYPNGQFSIGTCDPDSLRPNQTVIDFEANGYPNR